MLIAELGNNHFGSIKRFKTLIKAAHESGADLIKGQAFIPKDIHGSMPREFYEDCYMSPEQCIELIDYARDLGNDLFFSVFSNGFEKVSLYQKWHKIAGSQTRAGRAGIQQDLENVIISVPRDVKVEKLHQFKFAEVLHVSDYLTTEPQLEQILVLSDWLDGRSVGYSDHTIGIGYASLAYRQFGAEVIEKHFCLKNSEQYRPTGTMFRDTIHGVTPSEFEKLAIIMSQDVTTSSTTKGTLQ